MGEGGEWEESDHSDSPVQQSKKKKRTDLGGGVCWFLFFHVKCYSLNLC